MSNRIRVNGRRTGVVGWVLSGLLVSGVAVAEVAVVVHPSNAASLSKDDIERIFLGKVRTFQGGGTVNPMNLAESQSARGEFDQKVLGRNASQLKAYWSKLVFTGKGAPPPEVADAAAMIQAIAADPSGIGYVDAGAVNESVKVVATF
ncbi:MAG: phosphate ABC transporter substrate-binding protein [Gammaproteobacteria bacterium]|nr:phosphate ABC transporter substrate-binding protein [Gammaproteobacteria bacterium]